MRTRTHLFVVIAAAILCMAVGLAGFAGARARTTTLLRLGALCVAGWFVYGFAHWCLARALAGVAAGTLPFVTGVVALAWVGGYLTVIMPAGLGVRDGLLALLLAPLLGSGPVLLFVALARVLALVLELLIFAGWVLGKFSSCRR